MLYIKDDDYWIIKPSAPSGLIYSEAKKQGYDLYKGSQIHNKFIRHSSTVGELKKYAEKEELG